MWHASAAFTMHAGPGLITSRPVTNVESQKVLEDAARRALEGVGSSELGEWTHRPGEHEGATIAVHVRRRLTMREQLRVDPPVLDIRGSDEARSRIAAVQRYLPPGWTE